MQEEADDKTTNIEDFDAKRSQFENSEKTGHEPMVSLNSAIKPVANTKVNSKILSSENSLKRSFNVPNINGLSDAQCFTP